MAAWRYEISLLVLKNISLVRAPRGHVISSIHHTAKKRTFSWGTNAGNPQRARWANQGTELTASCRCGISHIINLPTETTTSYFMNQRWNINWLGVYDDKMVRILENKVSSSVKQIQWFASDHGYQMTRGKLLENRLGLKDNISISVIITS